MSDETCARREKRCSDFVALQAEIERLTAALKPFAELPEGCQCITILDVRRARRALEGK